MYGRRRERPFRYKAQVQRRSMAEEEEDLSVDGVENKPAEHLTHSDKEDDKGVQEERSPETLSVSKNGSGVPLSSSDNSSLSGSAQSEGTATSPSATPLPPSVINGSAEKKKPKIFQSSNNSPTKSKFSLFKKYKEREGERKRKKHVVYFVGRVLALYRQVQLDWLLLVQPLDSS